jgi:hypothetical protein
MKSLSKSMQLLTDLNANELLTHAADRMELKRQRSGHFRLYMHFGDGVKPETMGAVETLLNGRGMTANPFKKAGQIQHITFVDDDEDTGA